MRRLFWRFIQWGEQNGIGWIENLGVVAISYTMTRELYSKSRW